MEYDLVSMYIGIILNIWVPVALISIFFLSFFLFSSLRLLHIVILFMLLLPHLPNRTHPLLQSMVSLQDTVGGVSSYLGRQLPMVLLPSQ